MHSINMTAAEIERFAYISGNTLAAEGWGAFDCACDDVETLETSLDNALDFVGCSGKRGTDLYSSLQDVGIQAKAAPVMECALRTLASALSVPGRITKRQLVDLSKVLLAIVETPDDFNRLSVETAVYNALD